MRSRVISTCLAAAAAAFAAAPAQADQLTLQPLRPTTLSGPFTSPVRDTVLRSPANVATASSVTAQASLARFTAPDGVSIPVQVSTAYKASNSVIQGYVNYLDSLMHGSELANIHVFIAPPKQL